MNKAQLKKSEGHIVKLQPAAIGSHGRPSNDDWLIMTVEPDKHVEIENLQTKHKTRVGIDAVAGYFSDVTRTTATTTYGFLQLLAQVQLYDGAKVTVTPLPPPRAASAPAPPPELHPLIVKDGKIERHFTWQGRDPVHLLNEERPRQLMRFFERVCEELRIETAREPAFCTATRLSGDVVYEVSNDHRARWPLLGGAGGRAGEAWLVLTEKPARSVPGDLGVGSKCSKGHHVGYEISKTHMRDQLVAGTMKFYCILCDESWPPSFEEIIFLKNKLRSGEVT